MKPSQIDLDGYVGSDGVRYIGTAFLQENGKYVCLAVVQNCLCYVECEINEYDDKKECFT